MVKKLIILSLTIAECIAVTGTTHSANHKITENGTGNVSGYLKPDRLFKDRMRIYGKDGKYKGEIRPDLLFKDRMRIYDADGRYKGEIRPDPLYQYHTPRPPKSNTERYRRKWSE